MKGSLSNIVSPAFALLALLIAACSGHGSSVPRASATGATGSHAAKPQYGVKVKLLIPSKPASTSHRRKRQYVSYQTQSAEIIVNDGAPIPFPVSSSASDCVYEEGGGACTVTVDAPAGSDTFTMKTFDGPVSGDSGFPSGNLLSSGTAVKMISATASNEVDLTLDGVVAGLSVYAYSYGSAVGTATSIPVYVTAIDPDNNDIIGQGSYIDANGNPVTITVSDADASGSTSISNPAVTDAYSAPSFDYTGAQLHGTIPVITASAAGIPSASTPYPFTPVMSVVVPSLRASPSAMTAGSDGNIYLLESVPDPNNTGKLDASVEKYVPGTASPTGFTYSGCLGNGLFSLNPGIVSIGSSLYFAGLDDCGQTETGTVVSMTQGGTFASPQPIDDEALADSVLGSSVLGYPGTGTSVQLVATVTPGPESSTSPPPIGPSFVTASATTGTATSYAFRTALGLSTTDDYSFINVPGYNVVTYDASANAWFPETIIDNTASSRGGIIGHARSAAVATGSSQNVMVRASTATATAFPIPSPSAGGVETIEAVTAGSDGKIWYVGNQQNSNGQTITVGNVTSGGVFTDFHVSSNNAAAAVSSAIIEGSDGALYTVAPGYIVQVTHAGVLTDFSSNATLDGRVTTGLKMSNGDIYFTGTYDYQQGDGELIRPALFQLLY